jgi:hypothetical protein
LIEKMVWATKPTGEMNTVCTKLLDLLTSLPVSLSKMSMFGDSFSHLVLSICPNCMLFVQWWQKAFEIILVLDQESILYKNSCIEWVSDNFSSCRDVASVVW